MSGLGFPSLCSIAILERSIRNLLTLRFTCRGFSRSLLAHEGPISNFTLKIPGLSGPRQIDRLLLHLPKKNVQDLTLYSTVRITSSIPASSLCFSELIHLFSFLLSVQSSCFIWRI
ncbi:unnamed protein product [Linum tenue]|nr:unnamed protein product [Linum tenue]